MIICSRSLLRITSYQLNHHIIRLISVFDGLSSTLPEDFESISRKFPTVSTIINRTMPAENVMILCKWQEKMRKQMGDQKFNEYVTRIKGIGKDVHQAICDILLKEKLVDEFGEPIDGYIRSLESIFTHVKTTHFVEQECRHPILRYRGRIDSINSFKTESGGLVLTEWKTVHESKRVTSLEKAYDAPLQVAAYTAAYNITRLPKMPQVRQGLIAYAYADGYPADVLLLDEEALEHYFQVWCSRVETYHQTVGSAGQ
ncbi:conserved hypothetical protein [Echinococcus multilocularis]|uniref:Mitochondrial genome maintenance exonuclease 1 n=1 Tax=Echinococcus multilocularis TaxID=6211 RepID=A0A087W1E4_ECHMU|nr:conserved hypothetical protein [Echinococcus multilocularis]